MILVNENFTFCLTFLSVMIKNKRYRYHVVLKYLYFKLARFVNIHMHFQFLFVLSTFGKCFMLVDLKYTRVYTFRLSISATRVPKAYECAALRSLEGENLLKLRFELFAFQAQASNKHAFIKDLKRTSFLNN